ILTEMEKVKFAKFDLLKREGVFLDYHKQFDDGKECKICGRERGTHGDIGDNCNELIKIGENLVNDRLGYLVIKKVESGPVFGIYDYSFEESITHQSSSHDTKVLDISLSGKFRGYGKSKINTYVAKNGYTIKTFEEIAFPDEDSGANAIGVFKADVDNMAAIFAIGLEEKTNGGENPKLTFSRISQLSRMINNFFAYYLPYKLKTNEKYKDMYTVFAGGDDLFIIGRYDRIFDLAIDLSKEFKRYTGCNEEVTISGGISIFKPNTPIAFMAEVVEDNLNRSKRLIKNGRKGNLTILSATAPWEDFQSLRDEILENKQLIPKSSSFQYKLLELMEMKIRVEDPYYKDDILKNIMWLPRLKYILSRHIKEESVRKTLSIYFLKHINENTKIFKSLSMLEIYKNRKIKK
ncbi:MAG: hypothetical protein LDL09_07535, partial [Calditerrivibrio sp.]|nr:hypothetical protein [Calditerrivibrio sp.]